ncbi:MAG: S-layer homology domain-containing protein, partial [Clostridia bacterium]|nr:S-layer homology domain-containing protein [Clostridia bacterium]
MKRLFSIILTAAMLAGAIAFLPSSATAEGELPFKDVKTSSWYYDSVKYVYENGLMNGVGKTEFAPESTLNRAMFITIIGRLVNGASDKPSPFTDTVNDSWYSPYVAWAADLGIVNGFPDGTFRPGDPITREQMAVATARFLDATGLNTIPVGGIFDFADEEMIASWARESTEALKKVGVFAGDNMGKFNPGNKTTRAQAAT